MFDYWEFAMQLSVVLVGLLVGGTFTVPAINWLKMRLGTSGGGTLIIVAIFAAVITLATAVVEGFIAPGTINPQTWGAMLLAIILQANARYRQLKDELNEDGE